MSEVRPIEDLFGELVALAMSSRLVVPNVESE